MWAKSAHCKVLAANPVNCPLCSPSFELRGFYRGEGPRIGFSKRACRGRKGIQSSRLLIGPLGWIAVALTISINEAPCPTTAYTRRNAGDLEAGIIIPVYPQDTRVEAILNNLYINEHLERRIYGSYSLVSTRQNRVEQFDLPQLCIRGVVSSANDAFPM